MHKRGNRGPKKIKKLTLAFLYNVRHIYPDPNNQRSHLEADFEDPPTVEMMIKYLKRAGFKVIPIEANEKAYLALYKNKDKIDLAFNYSEGIYGNDREAHLPAMLEMLKIPYTGSCPLTQALGLNKAKTKEILLAHNIPTLPFQLFTRRNEPLNPKLKFPLIVKPIAQGSSAGITNKSIVFNQKELSRQISFVLKIFNQPALVEPFLEGREFSVGMLGNPPEFLPIIEADHSLLPKGYMPIDSLEVKWLVEEQAEKPHLICPAKIKRPLKEKIKKISLDTWKALGTCDLCRIDIRCDKKENPFVLEINSPPGLIPPEISLTAYFPLMAREAGIDYKDLLKKIVKIALKRSRKDGKA